MQPMERDRILSSLQGAKRRSNPLPEHKERVDCVVASLLAMTTEYDLVPSAAFLTGPSGWPGMRAQENGPLRGHFRVVLSRRDDAS